MAKHLVKCLYCGEIFDANQTPFVKINRRYAHQDCLESTDKKILKAETDKNNFYQMVKNIYGPKYNYMMINKQAMDYIKRYNYTWNGMAACLHWFYNINHGNIEDGHGGIGIIPFIYDQVKEYYNRIYDAQEKNKWVIGQSQTVEFNIHSPRGWHQPPHLLNLEENNADN